MNDMLQINLEQAAKLITAIGAKRSVLVEGHMGTGKTSLLKMLGEQFPEHQQVYFDCTTKDLGDLSVPNIVGDAAKGRDYVTFSPNEEFGVHTGRPVILMFDEIGKANPMVQQGLTRVLLERTVGSRPLPEGSLVFATTNLGAENVGDMLAAHQRNRLTMVKLRKPDANEWIGWAMNNNVNPVIMSWVKDFPQVFQSFTETTPRDNPYIFHPAEQRDGFVTPRSLEAASDILKTRELMDDTTLTSALAGTIGSRAALDMTAYIQLADQLPSLESIKRKPQSATVPTSAAAVCMVVFRTLANIESSWVDEWMQYLARLDTEAQALFANGARSKDFKKQAVVMRSKSFQEWARNHAYLYTADK